MVHSKYASLSLSKLLTGADHTASACTHTSFHLYSHCFLLQPSLCLNLGSLIHCQILIRPTKSRLVGTSLEPAKSDFSSHFDIDKLSPSSTLEWVANRNARTLVPHFVNNIKDLINSRENTHTDKMLNNITFLLDYLTYIITMSPMNTNVITLE